MPFFFSSQGVKFLDAYDADAPSVGLVFDPILNTLNIKGNTGSTKPIADADPGEGPPLTEDELLAKLRQYCVLKQEPGAPPQTVQGNLVVTGDISGSRLLSTSDMRLKENVEPISAVDFSKIQAYRYNLKDSDVSQFGIMAQHALEVGLGELVFEDTDGKLSVDYQGLTALLLSKVNELQERIEKLEKT